VRTTGDQGGRRKAENLKESRSIFGKLNFYIMKKLRMVLPVLAFLFAIGAAFGSVLVQTGFYDSNGSAPGGAQSGTIDQTSENCQVQGSVICSINGRWAFDTEGHAEANMDEQSNEEALGLLKYVP